MKILRSSRGFSHEEEEIEKEKERKREVLSFSWPLWESFWCSVVLFHRTSSMASNRSKETEHS